MVACHILAAVRIATSRATPAPTPVAMAQLRASVHVAERSAGMGGGLLPRTPFHTFSSTRVVMRPDTAPDPSAIAFQLYVLTVAMVSSYPGSSPHETWVRASPTSDTLLRPARKRLLG
jgi:hypothetical protein